jgi:hypothetical protein
VNRLEDLKQHYMYNRCRKINEGKIVEVGMRVKLGTERALNEDANRR